MITRQRTTISTIQQTVLKRSRSQAFWAAILENALFWVGPQKNIWEEFPRHIDELSKKRNKIVTIEWELNQSAAAEEPAAAEKS